MFAVAGEGAVEKLVAIADGEWAVEGAGGGFPCGADGVEVVGLPLVDPVGKMGQ